MAHSGWEEFICFVGEKAENMDTKLYKDIRRLFPVQLMMGLLNTTVRGSSEHARDSAARLITAEFKDIIMSTYEDLLEEHLLYLQDNTLQLFKEANNSAHIYRCTIAAASTLLSLSIHHYRTWNGFIEFSTRALSRANSSLDLVLEVVSLQRRKVQEKFIKLLEPYFETAHVCTLSTLLRRGDDYRVFTFLPILMKMLGRKQWDGLMKMAILSPYLDRENELRNRLKVLEALVYCINYSAFEYSDAMARRTARLIQRLYVADDEAERLYAGKLCAALACTCFPRKWRIGNWGVG